MIAELFYPKELKELISSLQEKGDFKIGSMTYIDREWIIPFALFFSISLLVMLFGEGLYVVPFLFLISIILTSLTYKRAVRRYVIPYTCGYSTLADVISLKHEVLNPGRGWWVRYKFSDSSGNIIYSKIGPIVEEKDFGKKKPVVGQKMRVYVNPSDSNANALYVENLFKRFCLSVSREKMND